jgi:hypothetical protein
VPFFLPVFFFLIRVVICRRHEKSDKKERKRRKRRIQSCLSFQSPLNKDKFAQPGVTCSSSYRVGRRQNLFSEEEGGKKLFQRRETRKKKKRKEISW